MYFYLQSTLIPTAFSKDSMLSKYDNTSRIPLLQHWGQTVTTKMFGVRAKLSAESRKGLLDIIEEIKAPSSNQVLLLKPNAPKIISSLPYVLGYACAAGKISELQVNLSKPILVVGSGDKCMSKLEKMLSSQKKISFPYLQQRGFITKLDKLSGAYYRTYIVKNSSGARKVASMKGQCDIVLCSDCMIENLPDHSFSLVLTEANAFLNEAEIRNKFEDHCKVVVMRYCSDQLQGKCDRSVTSCLTSKLTDFSKMFQKERILPLLSENQANAMDNIKERLKDGSKKHIPIEINAIFNQGMQTFLAVFPYLIGCACNESTSNLDMYKPILMMATDDDSWALLKQVTSMKDNSPLVSTGLMTEEELDKGLHYTSHAIEDDFDLCTYSKDIHKYEVILARQEMVSCPGKSTRKCLEASSFSAVVVVKSITGDIDYERKLIRKFSGLPLTFMRISGHQNCEIEVPSLLSTVQHFGPEFIAPTLIGQCRYVKCEYLLGEGSILDNNQQKFLTSLLGWLTGTERQVKFTTRFGFNKAILALQSLPFLLEWAQNNELVSTSHLKYDKPLLIICCNNDSFVHIRNSCDIHEPLRSANKKCPSCKYSSPSNSQGGMKFGNNVMEIAQIDHLKNLPDSYYPVVLAFSNGELSNKTMQEVNQKFGDYSKLAFYEACANSNSQKQGEYSNYAHSLELSNTEPYVMEKVNYSFKQSSDVQWAQITDINMRCATSKSDHSETSMPPLQRDVEKQANDGIISQTVDHSEVNPRLSRVKKFKARKVVPAKDAVTTINLSCKNDGMLERSANFILGNNQSNLKCVEDFNFTNVSNTNSTKPFHLNESQEYMDDSHSIGSMNGTRDQKCQKLINEHLPETIADRCNIRSFKEGRHRNSVLYNNVAMVDVFSTSSIESFEAPKQCECLFVDRPTKDNTNQLFTKYNKHIENDTKPTFDQQAISDYSSNKTNVSIVESVELLLEAYEMEIDKSTTMNISHASSIETMYLEPITKNSNTEKRVSNTTFRNARQLIEDENIGIEEGESIETIYLEPQPKNIKSVTLINLNCTAMDAILHEAGAKNLLLEPTNSNRNSNDHVRDSGEVECLFETQGSENHNNMRRTLTNTKHTAPVNFRAQFYPKVLCGSSNRIDSTCSKLAQRPVKKKLPVTCWEGGLCANDDVPFLDNPTNSKRIHVKPVA